MGESKGKRPDVVTERGIFGEAKEPSQEWPGGVLQLGPSCPGPWLGLLLCLGGWGLPSSVSEWLAAVSARSPSAPPVSRPPLPSSAQTAEAFQRKLLLILAAIPGHPHPQPPLRLGPCRGTKSFSESRPEALGVRNCSTSCPAADLGAPASRAGRPGSRLAPTLTCCVIPRSVQALGPHLRCGTRHKLWVESRRGWSSWKDLRECFRHIRLGG